MQVKVQKLIEPVPGSEPVAPVAKGKPAAKGAPVEEAPLQLEPCTLLTEEEAGGSQIIVIDMPKVAPIPEALPAVAQAAGKYC